MDKKTALIFAFLALVVITFTTSARRYLYLWYQHAGAKIGANFNNITTGDYVQFIKSQPDELEGDTKATFLNHDLRFIDRIADSSRFILGERLEDENKKWIEVDLSSQKLYMREGDNSVGEFLVSTGKWAPTPSGEFRIWTKLRYTRMSGGSQALGTYYNLPNVPYTMYYDRGYGIHGAYWHNNFGNTMSHGCTNMRPEEAGIVFAWANVGTRVVVHE